MSFGVAAYILNKNVNPNRLAAFGALVGIVGFSFIVFSEPTKMVEFFIVGVFLIGFGGGLFSISCLTAAMHINFEGFSGQEVARALKISVEAVESLLARARRTMRKELSGALPDLLGE